MGLLALLMAAAAVAVSPAAASADFDLGAVPIGSTAYGTMAVDDSAGLVFVSMTTSNVIDEFNFAGDLVGSIPNVYGAWGMTLDGSNLYTVENTTGRIVRIDLSSSSTAPITVTSGLDRPTWLAITGGRLWVATGGTSDWGSVIGVDPSTCAQTVLPPPEFNAIYAPDVAASPGDPDSLFVAEDGQSPGAIYRYDVSTTPATLTAQNPTTDQENIEELAVSPNGSAVIPAAGSPYFFEELSAATLQPDGVGYGPDDAGDTYPSAVAVSASGLLATGLNDGYNTVPDISLYQIGTPPALWSVNTDNADGTANVFPHGLALSADGSHLFAVTRNDVTDHAFFNAFSTGISRPALGAPSSLTPGPCASGTSTPGPSTGASAPGASTPGSSTTPAADPTQLVITAGPGHGPDVSMKIDPVRQTLRAARTGKVTGHRYFLEAKAIRCTGAANKINFTVAGHSYTSRCRRGPLLISRALTPLHAYAISVRALKTRRHKVLERGVTHRGRLKLPGKKASWQSITRLPPIA